MIPNDLQFALMTKLVAELNQYIRKNDDNKEKQSEISQLRNDLYKLTQKQIKLEKLLNDLEKVK